MILTSFSTFVYSVTRKIHSSSGLIVRKKLCIPRWSCRAKHFLRAYSAASGVYPMALHDVLTARRKWCAFVSSCVEWEHALPCFMHFSLSSSWETAFWTSSTVMFAMISPVAVPHAFVYSLHLINAVQKERCLSSKLFAMRRKSLFMNCWSDSLQ